MSQIKTITEKSRHEDLSKKDLPFLYESKMIEETTPSVSFDGGIATIFPGELAEAKIIKVAGATPPKWESVFTDLQTSMFHVLSGVLKWPQGADLSEEDVIEQTIKDALEVDVLLEMLDHLGISEADFKVSMTNHLHYKRGAQVEDAFREILEWALIVNFWARQKKNKNLDFSKRIPYLIVKDGSLFPYGKSIGDVMSKSIETFLMTGNVPIVGMVKASRFVAEDSSYRRAINKYLRELKGNCFFQIPKALEKKMDNKDINYQRYFFSLYSGTSVYEIQIPKSNIVDENYVKEVMDVLNSQVTFSFGGSVSTNSYAHQKASLAESEARLLTEKLKMDLKKGDGSGT